MNKQDFIKWCIENTDNNWDMCVEVFESLAGLELPIDFSVFLILIGLFLFAISFIHKLFS